jgi:ABC-type branched-subunit amino acid transport system substrate-binding protein
VALSTPVLAGAVCVLLAASPFLYRAWQGSHQLQITKLALLDAFTGPLQARGNDALAAAQAAVQAANASPAADHRLFWLTASDERADPHAAADQARSAAADRGIRAVLCCATAADLAAAQPLLAPRQALLPLLPDARRMAAAEAALAARQWGTGPVALISDDTVPASSRAAVLLPAFRQAGFAVTIATANFAAGSLPDQLAAAVVRAQPRLVVLDADYPTAATLGQALRTAGLRAPLLGDERLDGAEAARELAGLEPWWYVAPDRADLLQAAPAAFASDFTHARGHAPSSADALVYLQALAATGLSSHPFDLGAVPITLYAAVPGRYPPATVASMPSPRTASGRAAAAGYGALALRLPEAGASRTVQPWR